MKKKLILSAFILIAVTLTVILLGQSNERVIYSSKIKEIPTTDTLAMMYETESGSGEYIVSDDTSWPLEGYTFNAELSRCENGSKLYWDEETQSVMMEANVSDKCYVYFDVEPTLAELCSGKTFSECIMTQAYTGTDGENGLYYHDADLANGAQDNSYRYSGANPNNYVCFGATESPCSEENLYRIIGVFDDDKDSNYQIKLIKSDYTTSAMLGTDGRDYFGTYNQSTSYYKGSMDTSTIVAYRWNYDTSVSSNGSNNWTTSEFNKVNLNTNYWNYLGSTWQNLIAETTWHLGGMTSYNNAAKEFYDGERNNAGYGSNPTTYTDEIGLMYPSDYGYAANPDAWTTSLYNYDNSTIKSNNWMFMGLNEWTITPLSSNSNHVFVLRSGLLSSGNANNVYAARPVFYIESNVQLEGGSGTTSDPYTLAV